MDTSRTKPGRRRWAGPVFLAAGLVALTPGAGRACACGCGIFEVGTGARLPTEAGGTVFLEYDFMNQNRNWSGSSSAPAAANSDRQIRTSFITAGAQYMFDRAWGLEVLAPWGLRRFTTTAEDTGQLVTVEHAALGDVRIKGFYAGFSPDRSTGLAFGLKLPTGQDTLAGFDRDTQLGTGSTDLLLGAYHRGRLAGAWDWFVNGELDLPALIQDHYRPGSEGDAVAGVYYTGWTLGALHVAPIAQVLGSSRRPDRGSAADPLNTGYARILLAPGIEIKAADFRIYGELGFPVYEHVRGNQLVAELLYKLNVGCDF